MRPVDPVRSSSVIQRAEPASQIHLKQRQPDGSVDVFFSSRRRHTRFDCDWSSDVCSSDLVNREQTDLAVLAIDSATGSTKPLHTEHDDAWLNTDSGAPKWLEDGSGFLWMTEARSAWTLELHAKDGALVRPLTKPELGLRALVGAGNDGAIVLASAEAPKQAVW